MDMINRCAVLVQPALPFLEWLRRVDPTSAELVLEDLRREPTIYLLPEWETEQEALQHLAKVCSENLRGLAEWLVSCALRLARRAKPESVSPLVRLQFPFDGRRSL